MPDPNDKDKDKKGGKRVFKSEADKKLQEKMEGKDTPFQNALREAEAKGKKTFKFDGKLYAARVDPRDSQKEAPKKVEPRKPDTSTPAPKMDAPKRVKTQGSEKILAKDVSGNPLYQKRNKASRKSIAKRLKKRQKNRGY